MCSICGMVDFVNRNNINERIVKKMGNMLTHRGPDQNGVFTASDVAFQHNRLAIVDIENGLQPMTRQFDGKSYTIIYNGEIYNTAELSRELASYGVQLTTRCDTEVVLYSYIIFREHCPEKLNGIFAFAVYDEAQKQVYLARDRFGIKPLFYAQKDTTLLFASEIKALLQHPKVQPIVDQRGLWQLLYLTPVTLNGTSVFKDIFEIKPGCYGVFQGDTLSEKPYWKLEAHEFKDSRDDAIDHTRQLLIDAINRQLVSDVPLCTLLSGGLDSSVITSVASRTYQEAGRQLDTYSFEYEDNQQFFHSSLFQPQSDDYFASYLADYLKTKHHVLNAPTRQVADLLIDATSARDFPGQADIDSSLLYYCSQIKKEHTVALSGECADEIFGGYPWFYREEMLNNPFFPWIHDPQLRIGLFDEQTVKAEEGYQYLSNVYRTSMQECPTLDTDDAIMARSRKATWLSVNYFMISLLERKDRMSMASAVEVRVPYADHRILEYVFNVPWDIKFENQTEKALLRNAMQDYLPDAILHRKKSPYPKTHNPQYSQFVTELFQDRLASHDTILKDMMNGEALQAFLQSGEQGTWFGQLMSKPQLIAWLVQLDFWMYEYKIQIQ